MIGIFSIKLMHKTAWCCLICENASFSCLQYLIFMGLGSWFYEFKKFFEEYCMIENVPKDIFVCFYINIEYILYDAFGTQV